MEKENRGWKNRGEGEDLIERNDKRRGRGDKGIVLKKIFCSFEK